METKSRRNGARARAGTRAAFIGAMFWSLAAGCGWGTDANTPVALELYPPELNTIVGARIPIQVSIVRANRTTVVVSPRAATFRSSNAAVVRMSPDTAGLAIVESQGSAEIGVAATLDGRRLVKTIQVRVGFVIPAGP